jgi:hypothetical protein
LAPKIFTQGIRMHQLARGAVSAELSVLDSLHPSDASFDGFISGFIKDLIALDSVLEGEERVYRLLADGDVAGARAELARIKSRPAGGQLNQLEAAQLRVLAFGERAGQKAQEYEAILNADLIDIRAFKMRVYAMILAATYAGGFAVFVLRRWRDAIRSESRPLRGPILPEQGEGGPEFKARTTPAADVEPPADVGGQPGPVDLQPEKPSEGALRVQGDSR